MISVVIPVHNGAKTIRRAIESVESQSVDLEFIIVDDFSTDNSVGIINEMGYAVYSVGEIRRTQKPSGAANIPRNIGVSLSTGEYIAFLDQDDWWEPTKLKEQLEAIQGYNLCTTSFYAHNERIGTKRLHGNNTGNTVESKDIFKRFLSRDKSKQTLMSTLLFRKEIYPQMDEIFGITDFLWTARLVENAKAVVIEKPLTNRSVHSENTSYKNYFRELNLYEQLSTVAYYEHLYEYDLGKTKIGAFNSYAKYLYSQGEYSKARKNFHIDDIKIMLYYMTSFIPIVAKQICKKYNVWGDN